MSNHRQGGEHHFPDDIAKQWRVIQNVEVPQNPIWTGCRCCWKRFPTNSTALICSYCSLNCRPDRKTGEYGPKTCVDPRPEARDNG